MFEEGLRKVSTCAFGIGNALPVYDGGNECDRVKVMQGGGIP